MTYHERNKQKNPNYLIEKRAKHKAWRETNRETYLNLKKQWRETDPHKLTRTSWNAIKARCQSKGCPEYLRYGAIGINICPEWENFDNFLRDMGPRSSLKYSIDRIDNSLGYYKENCRWATDVEQANNTSRNKFITFNNKTQTMAQWEKELGLKRKTLYDRFQRGWSIEKALTTPLNQSYTKEGRSNKNQIVELGAGI